MIKKQQGLSLFAWIGVLGLAVIIITCAVKMVPVYMDDLYMQRALRMLAANNQNLQDLEKGDIRSQLSKFMTVNNIDGQNIENFKIKRERDRMLITNVYEVRRRLMYNIEVVMSFENQLDSSNADACCDYLVPVKTNEKKYSPASALGVYLYG